MLMKQKKNKIFSNGFYDTKSSMKGKPKLPNKGSIRG